MKPFSWAFIAIAPLLTRVAAQWPNPLPCEGVCDNDQDPALIRRASDGTWFRFVTGNDIDIYTAPNFTGPWSHEGNVLPGCSKINIPGNCDLWGPDVTLIGDTYYLYYAVSTIAVQYSAIGLATSKTLETGSWTDHGTIIQSNPGDAWNAIDPNLLIISQNESVLTFGSYFGGIYQISQSNPPPTTEIDLSQTTVSHLASMSDTLINFIEGAFLFKWDNYYYLFFSEGICCAYNVFYPPPGSEYKIKVCRSLFPNRAFVDENGSDCLTGDGGTIILGSHDNVLGPGGQGVYITPNQGPILYYHFANKAVGLSNAQKAIGINYLSFASGWPVVVDAPWVVGRSPNSGSTGTASGNATATGKPKKGGAGRRTGGTVMVYVILAAIVQLALKL